MIKCVINKQTGEFALVREGETDYFIFEESELKNERNNYNRYNLRNIDYHINDRES